MLESDCGLAATYGRSAVSMATQASHAAPWAKSSLNWTLSFSGSSPRVLPGIPVLVEVGC